MGDLDPGDFDDLWPVPEPPEGFARRVLARRTRRSGVAAAVAVAACVLLVTGGLWWAARGPASGSANPLSRSTIDLDGRAIAVAEAGASLRWTVQRGGAAGIEQPSGDVFYRVEPGGPFVVNANGVSISVTGTCFRVEVTSMKPMFAAAAGAAVASAVLVTVYEGTVNVRNGGAATPLSAGEQARAEPGSGVVVQKPPVSAAAGTGPNGAPGPGAAPTEGQLTREQLVERDAASRQQVGALQARVQQLERERQALLARKPSEDESPPPEAEGLPPRGKTHDFTSSELQSMAHNCEVRIDTPPLDNEKWKLSPDLGAWLHLSEDQQPRVAAAVNKVRDEAIARLRALYLEATGDAGGAQSLAPMTLPQEILHKSRPAEVDAARARVARERAGIDAAPPDPDSGTIPERYFRYMVTVGDSLQRELEPAVGASQAGVIRDRVDGSRMQMNGCKEPTAPSSSPSYR